MSIVALPIMNDAWLMQREAVRLSRKNDNIRPFEVGGEIELEHLARRADTGAHSLSSHFRMS